MRGFNAMLDSESADNLESNDVLASTTSNLPHGLSALRHREFRLLWFGTFASNVGSWAQKVATAWLIYHITNSEAWLGIDAFASGIPTVLLLPWGGVMSDRVNRRNLLIWTNVASAGLAFTLAVCPADRPMATVATSPSLRPSTLASVSSKTQ